MKQNLRPPLVLIAYIATVSINTLANLVPFNGKTTGEISNSFPVFFVPAGYTFSIWGFIYLLLGIYAVYQAFPLQRQSATLDWIGKLFVLGSLANIAWILEWHYGHINYTIVSMGILFFSLLVSYKTIRKHKREPEIGRWVVRVPFAIYLGWITVATIANATVVLYNLGWNGFGISGQIWSAILIAVATLIALVVIVKEKDLAYASVIAWGLLGVYIKFNLTEQIVSTSALVATVIIIASIATQAYRIKKNGLT